jgi:hypothetical protein
MELGDFLHHAQMEGWFLAWRTPCFLGEALGILEGIEP